jgi:hypothetical protein
LASIYLSDSRFYMGSTHRCITRPVLHLFWTKFWNVTLLKIILFSPVSNLAPTCTHRYEIIPFHKLLRQDIQWIIFPCHVYSKSSFNHGYVVAIYVVRVNSLVAIKIDSYWRFRNTVLRPQRERYCSQVYGCIQFLKFLFLWQSLLLFWMYLSWTLSRNINHW